MSWDRFISFEGGEGSGKSTQLRLLAETLTVRGQEVICAREPGGTRLGEEVRRLLLAPDAPPVGHLAETLLFATARAQLVEEVIAPALRVGQWVLADRFLDSTVVYQGVAGSMARADIDAVNAIAVRDMLPRRTLVLDVPVAVGLSRAQAQQEFEMEGGDRIERRVIAFHENVRKGYHALARAEPERVRLIDARGSIEEVRAACWAAIQDLVPEP